MRNLLGHIMLLIYLFSLSGLKVKLHFCESEFAHWSLISQNYDATTPECCEENPVSIDEAIAFVDSCNMEDCCEDQFVQIDAEKDYVNASNNSLDLSHWIKAILPAFLDNNNAPTYFLEESINIRNTGPPIEEGGVLPIYLKIQKLIFYA